MLTETLMWYDIPPELIHIDDRLDNWGRWARERPKLQTARSAEGRYHPPAVDDFRRIPSIPIDILDASLVDRCLAPATGFPSRYTKLLVLYYVRALADRSIRQKLRIHIRDYPYIIRNALFAAQNVIDIRTRQRDTQTAPVQG